MPPLVEFVSHFISYVICVGISVNDTHDSLNDSHHAAPIKDKPPAQVLPVARAYHVRSDMCVSPEPPHAPMHAPRTGRVHKENAPPSNNTMRSGADRSTQTHSQHKMHIVCMCLVHAYEHVLFHVVHVHVHRQAITALVSGHGARCQANLGQRARAGVPVSALPEWSPLSYLAMCP